MINEIKFAIINPLMHSWQERLSCFDCNGTIVFLNKFIESYLQFSHRAVTKTKAITMANHNKRRQQNEPIRTRSKKPAPSAGKRVRPSRDCMVLVLHLIG